MDYKTLHGGGSLAPSSRAMPGRNLAESARNLRAVLPDEASEALARVEDLLVEIAGCAPEELVAPAPEAHTARGHRAGAPRAAPSAPRRGARPARRNPAAVRRKTAPGRRSRRSRRAASVCGRYCWS